MKPRIEYDGHKFVDLTGDRFGHLTVVSLAGVQRTPAGLPIPRWTARCDCGATVTRTNVDITRSRNKLPMGCGRSCPLLDIPDGVKYRHGMTHHRAYQIWMCMRVRCHDLTDPNYGGRGIKVCPEWEDFVSFWRDMERGYSDKLQLDRIDVNGNYAPTNCRWVTVAENAQNRRSSLQNRGCPVNHRELIAASGLGKETVHSRLRAGWSWDKAISTPSKRKLSVRKETKTQ